MDSPGIDLDMTLTSSPIVGGDVDDDDWETKNDDNSRNDKYGIYQPSTATTVSKSHSSNDSIINNDETIMLSKNHDKHVQGINKGEPLTNNNATEEERTKNNDNLIVVKDDDGNITIKQYYTKTMTMVELWNEEISMMNITNTILLNDLVKLGADV
jgi:hypothetical protein